jgi:hypothetical protein
METKARLTRHAQARLDQRGFRQDDVELLSWLGRPVEGGLMVCRKDALRVAARLQELADRYKRLAGSRLVIEGDAIVTAYRPGRRKARHLLRHTAERDLEGDWV